MNAEIPPQPTILFDAEGRIASALYCRSCGRDLRDLQVEGKCPQCQRPVAESLAGVLPVLDESGCVVTDIPCVACGYNLRTRPATALCPECGERVALSLRGHYLNQAPEGWIRRVARGATLLVISVASTIVLPVIGVCSGFALGLAGPITAARPRVAFFSLMSLLGLPVTVVFIWGLVYLTTPEPTMKFKREGLSARRLVRYCLLLLPLLIVGWVCMIAVRGFFLAPFASPLAIILSIAGAVAYVAIPLATLRHLTMLMRRVPRPGLVTFAKIEFWGLLITGGVYIASVIIVMIVTFTMMTPAILAAMGPNAPTAGPNAAARLAALGYVTPTSAPAAPANPWAAANTSKSYQVDPNGQVTVTTVGPGGVTTTTTMPASAPFPPALMPGPALMIGSAVMGLGACGVFGFSIAGFILLILARNALAGAARQAESTAVVASGANTA